MTEWNFAEVWETIAALTPDAPATSHTGQRASWQEFSRRADEHAAWLLSLGLGRQATVAQYLWSSPEYLTSVFGCFKAALIPVNTNYRYGADELAYLWSDAECRAVVFHGSFTETIEDLRRAGRVSKVRGWCWVDDGSFPCPRWAQPMHGDTTPPGSPIVAPWGRSGDDLWLLYTGGTTGRPKGVMWRQDDLFSVINRTAAVRYPEDGGLAGVRAQQRHGPGPVLLAAAPLMHGTGMIAALGTLSSGGCVATLASRSFDAAEALDVIATERAKAVVIVGDAFAKPMLAALDAEPNRWDITSLRVVMSSGVMWSNAVKAGLLRHNPGLLLVDTLGSSEAIGMASSISSADRGATSTASFQLGTDTRVIDDAGRPVEPGSDDTGVVALRGRGPLGYFRDEAKTATTFRVIDGVRWTIPGDHARVEADGSIVLLGRGSQCINTGGEKVYPEEVEEALKTSPAIVDAAVVGVPDDRFGEAITALVVPAAGAEIDAVAAIAHVKESLAAYKAPKHVLFVSEVRPAANGKLDYRALKEFAVARLAEST